MTEKLKQLIPGWETIKRLDELREAESRRIDQLASIRQTHVEEKFRDFDIKYQIQFTAAKEAVGIASVAQKELVAQALEGTKEAINKSDGATDKRFELLSEKIGGIAETISKNTGAQGIYVTHSDLAVVVDKIQTGFSDAMKPVVAFMNAQQGQQKGIDSSWGIIAGVVGFVSTVILLVLRMIGK